MRGKCLGWGGRRRARPSRGLARPATLVLSERREGGGTEGGSVECRVPSVDCFIPREDGVRFASVPCLGLGLAERAERRPRPCCFVWSRGVVEAVDGGQSSPHPFRASVAFVLAEAAVVEVLLAPATVHPGLIQLTGYDRQAAKPRRFLDTLCMLGPFVCRSYLVGPSHAASRQHKCWVVMMYLLNSDEWCVTVCVVSLPTLALRFCFVFVFLCWGSTAHACPVRLLQRRALFFLVGKESVGGGAACVSVLGRFSSRQTRLLPERLKHVQGSPCCAQMRKERGVG